MSKYGEYGFGGIAAGSVVGYLLGGFDGMTIGIILGVQLVWIPILGIGRGV